MAKFALNKKKNDENNNIDIYSDDNNNNDNDNNDNDNNNNNDSNDSEKMQIIIINYLRPYFSLPSVSSATTHWNCSRSRQERRLMVQIIAHLLDTYPWHSGFLPLLVSSSSSIIFSVGKRIIIRKFIISL